MLRSVPHVCSSTFPSRFGMGPKKTRALQLPVKGLKLIENPSKADIRASAKLMCHIETREFGNYYVEDYVSKAMGRYFSKPRTHLIVLKDGQGQVVATGGLTSGKNFKPFRYDRATEAYIAHLYMTKPYRQKGLGQWILKQLLKQAKVHGYRSATACCARQASISLMQKLGFKETWGPKKLTYMVKQLSSPNQTKST